MLERERGKTHLLAVIDCYKNTPHEPEAAVEYASSNPQPKESIYELPERDQID